MDSIKLWDSYNKKICIALGFFDSLHIGHQAIFARTHELARQRNAMFAVFTFSNNPHETLGKDIKLIYPFEQRAKYIGGLGADLLIHCNFDTKFMNEDKDVFMSRLFNSYDIAGVVTGRDYAFGAQGKGTAADLISYCRPRGIEVAVIDDITIDGERVSSTGIRAFVRQGAIESLRKYLSRDYAIVGKVIHGRGEGRKISFPTVNILMPKGCENLRNGVYATAVEIGGRIYQSVTNIGEQPTYGSVTPMIETHILDFCGDLYDTDITVSFLHRIRDTIRFDSIADLKLRITEDIRYVKDKNRTGG